MDDSSGDYSSERDASSGRRRRSPRVPWRVPLVARSGETVALAESLVVNAHGALVESTSPFEVGASLTLRNEVLGRDAEAWVIWVGSSREPGMFAMGIELAVPDVGFWGIRGRGTESGC